MSVTMKTDTSSDPSSGNLLNFTLRRSSKRSAKLDEYPKSAEEIVRTGFQKADIIVLREPGSECHSDTELKEVYSSMLSNQYYHESMTKEGYQKYRRVLVDWMCEIGDTIKQSYTTIHHAV